MAKQNIDNEPMLEENSDEILLEETSGTEAMLEESTENEVLLEETSESGTVMLEETQEESVLLEESVVSTFPTSPKPKASTQRLRTQANSSKCASSNVRRTRRNAEAAKAEAETRKAEAVSRQKLMEAEEKAKKAKKMEKLVLFFIILGCLIFLSPVIFLGLATSIQSCQGKHEVQEYQSSTLQETLTDTDDEIESSNLETESFSADEGVEAMLEKKFDYVSGSNRYFEVRKNGKYGIADLKGNVKIAPQYDYISSPDEDLGIIEVRKGGKYGMVSLKTLAEIIKPKYDYISSASLESKTIEVRANSKYGLLSITDFSEIVEPTYDYIGSYNGETCLFEVRKNSKYGLFSPVKKKEVAPCVYNYISYDGGLYHVRKEGKSGYLDSDGSILKPLQ